MCNATDEEVEYLKSVKGHFFGIDFDESAIYTDATDAWDEDEPFAGVGGWCGWERGSSKEDDTDEILILAWSCICLILVCDELSIQYWILNKFEQIN